jgi:hypothetical protein
MVSRTARERPGWPQQAREVASMPTRSLPGSIRRCVLLGLGLSLILTAGCMAQPRPFVAPLAVTTPPDLSFVIPSGTASADMRGEPSFKIPDDIVV